jgi:hypothetical protein
MRTMYTPGPWSLERRDDRGECFNINALGRVRSLRRIAIVENDALRVAESFYNAGLIAAAPDLVEALKEVLESLKGWIEIADKDDLRDYDDKAIEKAEAALKKALR